MQGQPEAVNIMTLQTKPSIAAHMSPVGFRGYNGCHAHDAHFLDKLGMAGHATYRVPAGPPHKATPVHHRAFHITHIAEYVSIWH